MDPLLRRLRRLTAPADPDGRLLARYAATGDPAAVEELVRRHGPTVWAAARRRLPDPADTADVFQATFLVLLQKGGRLTQSPTVGPWLYRVAALTARNLRRKNARRLARRRPLFDVPVETTHELRADLDDALLTLSERDRSAVVLCHLQGYSRREAAERLGLPEGTLSSVLSRALAKLRTKLGDDPLPLLAAGSLTVPAGVATAATNAAAVVRVASLTAAAGPEVVSLTREALRMFWVKKLAAGGMAVAACLGLGVGVGLAPRPAVADPPPAAEPLDALRRRAAEADRVARELAARVKQQEQRAAATGPRVRVRVSAENRPWDAYIRLEEFDADGKVVADYGCGGGKLGEASLLTHLRRARLDPAGPREVVLEVNEKLPLADLLVVAQAVADAGFPAVTYTGPRVVRDTTQVRLDKLQPLVKVGEVKGERVELAKVLPVSPRPDKFPPIHVEMRWADGSAEGAFSVWRFDAEELATVPVADAVRRTAKLAEGDQANIWVARPKPDGGEQVLPVDWVGITRRGETRTNYRLVPGDRLHIKR